MEHRQSTVTARPRMEGVSMSFGKMNSFKGIFRKVLIFTLVGIANIIDIHVLGEAGVLRTAVIFFYISNEGVSLLENFAHLGLPIPEKLKNVLEQLHDREGGKDNESE